MLILNNNELQHVDSTSEILEHYGVKGMKWGARKAGAWVKAYGGNLRRSITNPILTTKGMYSSMGRSYLGTGFGTTRSRNYINRYVDAHIAAKKHNKSVKKKMRQEIRENGKKYGNTWNTKKIMKNAKAWDAADTATVKKHKKKLIDRKNLNIKY